MTNNYYTYICSEWNNYKQTCNRSTSRNRYCIFFESNNYKTLTLDTISCKKGNIQIDWLKNIIHKDIINVYCITPSKNMY